MYILGLLEFITKIGPDDCCSKILETMKEYWPNDDKRSKKFKAAFEYYRARLPRNSTGSDLRSVMDKETNLAKRAKRGFLLYSEIMQEFSAKIPNLKNDLYQIAYDRHKTGQLHPWILPLLSHGEMVFDVGLEDQISRQYLIRSLDVTRPLRQILYGIIFSISEKINKNHKKNKVTEPILIREWYPCRNKPQFVQALPFANWKTPDLRVLWLSRNPSDYNKRARAFISAFLSDTPFLAEIQPRLVVPCLVLRYLHQQPGALLRINDINVFLAVALSPDLHNIGKYLKI
jgi:hypothetical protein